MKIEDILENEYTRDRIESDMIQQGNLVLQTIQTQGWDLVLGALIGAKIGAEKLRKKNLGKATSGDTALYYSGVVDGIEEAKEAIYNVVKQAEEVKKSRQMKKEMEEQDA